MYPITYLPHPLNIVETILFRSEQVSRFLSELSSDSSLIRDSFQHQQKQLAEEFSRVYQYNDSYAVCSCGTFNFFGQDAVCLCSGVVCRRCALPLDTERITFTGLTGSLATGSEHPHGSHWLVLDEVSEQWFDVTWDSQSSCYQQKDALLHRNRIKAILPVPDKLLG